MREAFGGTYMITLLLTFLAIYITFVAVALNFAKAFRIKNQIIDIIEQNEGIDLKNDGDAANMKIEKSVKDMQYYVELNKNDDACVGKDQKKCRCFDYGYCIEEIDGTSNFEGFHANYYVVTAYMRINFPFFGLDFSIPIEGETRKVERIKT